MKENISIIGAGISGLTLGIALQQRKIGFEIFESFDRFKFLGAGIILAGNAMEVFEELGLAEKIREKGWLVKAFNIRDPKLNRLTSLPQHSKISSIAIHRGTLQKVLLEEIHTEKIHLNKKFRSFMFNGNKLRLDFEDNTSHETGFMIGADGLHSQVRKHVVGNSQIRDAGQLCYRGIAEGDLPKKYSHELNELWGKGKRFGFVRINEKQIYWYAVLDCPSNKAYKIASLTEQFNDFDPLINRLISSTPESSIIKNRMQDLKPISKWYKDNICLIGDAAHATTPNMGQGACQGIEDALVLAHSLEITNSPKIGFQRFQKTRKKKALRVVNTSWRIGQIAHLNNPFFYSARNNLMRIFPTQLLKNQVKKF